MANNPFNLDTTVEYSGLWWIPDEPETKIPGVLRYDPETGVVLDLIGAFEDRITTPGTSGVLYVHAEAKRFEAIFGAADAQEITLLDCLPIRSSRRIGARVDSPPKQTIDVTFALVGSYATSAEDLLFEAAEFSVEDLGQWVNASQLEASFGVENGRPNGTGTVTIKSVDNLAIHIEDMTYTLRRQLLLPNIDRLRGKTVGRIQELLSFQVTRVEKWSLNEALQSLNFVRDLISLAMHRPVGVIWLRLETSSQNVGTVEDPRFFRQYTEVLYQPSAIGKSNEKESGLRRTFFNCSILPIEVVLPRWHEVHNRYLAAINMIMGLRYQTSRYVENDLLLAAGAAEVFHRGNGAKEKPIPNDEFKAMRAAILKQIPECYQSRFKGAIRNDPTLRERLIALAERLAPEVTSSLMPSIQWWASRTVKARNDLAHEGQTPNHTFEELNAIVKVTTTVVIFGLLDELGLTSEDQKKLIQDHPQLAETARNAHEELCEPSTNQFDSRRQ